MTLYLYSRIVFFSSQFKNLYSHQRRQNTTLFTTSSPPAVGFALTDASGTLQKPSFFPSVADLHSLHYDPEPFSSDIQRHNFPDHESNGIRFHR